MSGIGPPTKHTVVFTPSGLSGTVTEGATALEAARKLGVDLDSVCGGRGICGRCQVVPGIGEFPKWAMSVAADHVTPPGGLERGYRGKRPIKNGQRLGCDVQVVGDVVFDVPPESQIHKQVVRKGVNLDGLVVDPTITLHYLELAERRSEDGTSLTARIAEQLEIDWNIAEVDFDFGLLPELENAAAGRRLTLALRNRIVVGIWPGFTDRVVGVAIDIGSTTVAGHLCDLTSGEVLASAGRMNPQIRFGEDLMSRVSYVMMNDGGEQELTVAIRTALDELVAELLESAAAVDQSLTVDHLLDIVLVGNPIMHHLTLGIDPTPLGQSPFTLATEGPVNATATDLGINAPRAALYFAPCIAGHVGADTAAAILSEAPYGAEPIQLLIDVGTNAEIVLGNSERLFAASSPTGPAFEGAQISSGQRATAGAIERVRIDRETLEPRFKVIGSDLWSDEAGFAEQTSASGVTGVCGSGIIEAIGEMFLSGLIDAQGVIQGVMQGVKQGVKQGVVQGAGNEHTSRVVADERTFSYRITDRISITQADVRAIQLAKAALRAGIDLLLEHAELTSIDEVKLAGAFGAHIDPVYAMVLGLIPDCPVDRVTSVGNAAGSGAVRALLSKAKRAEMEQAVRRVTKIETATEPRFQDLFVAALAFPHLNASTANLAAAIQLPARAEPSQGDRPRRRRRTARGKQ